jgi:hypothetical protein
MEQASFADKMAKVEWLAEQDRWAAMSLPKRGTCIVDDETAVMDKEYFEALGEYSCSLPTGTYVGKRWKRNTVNTPRWKCSDCATMYAGWGTADQPCPDSGCDGKLKFIEVPPDWLMGEFYDVGSREKVGIRWRKIFVEHI